MKKLMVIIMFFDSIPYPERPKSFFFDTLPYGILGYHYVDENPMNPVDKWSTSFQTIAEDTIIASSVYKKVVDSTDSLFVSRTVRCLIREDSK